MGRSAAYGLPRPAHRVLDQTPAVSSDLAPALRAGAIAVRPGVARVDGACVQFSDGTTEMVDHIVLATGYRISFPFLSPALLRPDGMTLPLYRRIVPPEVPGLYFIGWSTRRRACCPSSSASLRGWQMSSPAASPSPVPPATMHAAADAVEPRTRERFPREHPHQHPVADPAPYLARSRATAAADACGGSRARSGRPSLSPDTSSQASSIGTSPRSRSAQRARAAVGLAVAPAAVGWLHAWRGASGFLARTSARRLARHLRHAAHVDADRRQGAHGAERRR
jgi:hypothetical protein